jgi:hypothetical protein
LIPRVEGRERSVTMVDASKKEGTMVGRRRERWREGKES